MKRYLYFLFIILFILFTDIQLFSQEQIKILTPFGSQPEENTFDVSDSEWEPDEVELCRQAWLNEGGIFLMTGDNVFSEKNNYLKEFRVRCMYIDGNTIYIGTDDGIYLASKTTTNGVSWINRNGDGIINLDGKIINSISIHADNIYACSNDGIWISENAGQSWSQTLSGKNVTCVDFGENNIVYAGATNVGLFKSTDLGSSWGNPLLWYEIYCIKYESGNLFVGASNGLHKSENGGSSWLDPMPFPNIPVHSIFKDGSVVYIGTGDQGCWRSTDSGNSFHERRKGLLSGSSYPKINSIATFNSKVFAATDNGVYKTNISENQWSESQVRDNVFPREVESLTKQIYIHDAPEGLWVVCTEHSSPKWPSAEMVVDFDPPLHPAYFPRYNCHGFAWHLYEGGVRGITLDNPNSMKYIPPAGSSQEELENWDYIETVWNDPLWDKVTYNWDHSGIKSPKMADMPDEIDSLIIISKWGTQSPLVAHKLYDNPWYGQGTNVRFWKSRKEVSGEITYDRRIGREIITEQDDEISTYISDGSDIELYVAPMHNSGIHFKPGFHAEKGSTLHAYIKDESKGGNEIPWEAEADKILLASVSDEKGKFDLTSKFKTENVPLWNYQNKTQQLDTSACKFYDWGLKFSGKGSGTKEDPFQITNIREFQEIGKDNIGYNYWILMNDIDASETHKWNPYVDQQGDTLYMGFEPLSREIKSLDGRGHIIRNLFVSNAFLFVSSHCLHLKRLGFENITIEARLGGIKIHRTYDSNSVIEECFITGNYKVRSPNNFPLQGYHVVYGFGEYGKDAIVRNCYTDLIIQADTTITHFAKIYQAANVSNCYAVGKPVGQYVNPPFYSVANQGEIRACFYDNETIKVTTNIIDRGIGLPTSEMKKREPFEKAGWDFENVWYIEEGVDYPKLRAFNKQLSAEKVNQVSEFRLTVSEIPQTNSYKINYELPVAGSVEIELYSTIGSKVQLLLSESNVQAGSYSFNLDGSALSSGLYFVVMKTSKEMLSQKIIIIN